VLAPLVTAGVRQVIADGAIGQRQRAEEAIDAAAYSAAKSRRALAFSRSRDRAWMANAGLETLYIDPGAPWENGYAESFNSKVRDELLNAEEFGSLLEAQVLAKEWRQDYNHVRPHSSLGYRTPVEFGAMVPRAGAAQRSRPEEPSVTVDPTLTAPGP
jgi:transposase InsO family protein